MLAALGVIAAALVASTPITAGCLSCSLLAAEPEQDQLTPPPLPPESPPDGKPLEKGPLIHRDGELGPLDEDVVRDTPAVKAPVPKKIPTQDPHINSFSLREVGFTGLATFYMDVTLPIAWLVTFFVINQITGVTVDWQGWAAVHGIATIAASAVLQWGVSDEPKENGLWAPLIGQLIGTAAQIAIFVVAATTPAMVGVLLLAGLATRYVVTPLISSVLLHRRFNDKPIEPDPPGVEVFRF